MENSTIKAAILAGADLLEKNPERYNYISSHVKSENLNGASCMLGFIGEATGFPDGSHASKVGQHFGIYKTQKCIFKFVAKMYSTRNEPEFAFKAKAAVYAMRQFAEIFN